MFTGEASPEATEGNSQLKATTYSTTEPLALLQSLMPRSFGVEEGGKHQEGLLLEGCDKFGILAGHVFCGVFLC